MWKKEIIRAVCTLPGLLFSIIVPARDLPVLPVDKSVSKEVFPDGLTCYVVSNGSEKGFADFTILDRSAEQGKETVFSFEDVIVSDEVATDSLLISMMNIIEDSGAPANHAIVICGDINASKVRDKLRYMSYMIEASEPMSMPEYVWDGDGKVRVASHCDSTSGFTTISLDWNVPRVPKEFNGTVQNAIYDKTVWELGVIAETGISLGLFRENIPMADFTYSHKGSYEDLEDEHFSLSLTVENKNAVPADSICREVLANIAAGEIIEWDYAIAHSSYIRNMESLTSVAKDNSYYTDMCRRSFLYGAPLVSEKEILNFHKSKDLSHSSRKKLFEGIAHALIDIDTPPVPVADVTVGFMLADTTALPVQSLIKTRVRSSKKDPMSGGVLWTFDNGFKVIYKKMPSDNVMYYALALNGGYGDISDLRGGEGAFISDYLDMCKISGIPGRDFKTLMTVAGVTMDTRVGLSNTVISGSAYDNNIDLVMKGLLAIANDRSQDTLSVARYIEQENTRLKYKGPGVKARIDSLMCPEYRYSSYKRYDVLTDTTADKAEVFFCRQMSQMNDGVLVLVGDMDEVSLRKKLQYYVGEFRTSRSYSAKNRVQYQPVSGESTYHVTSDRNELVIAMSTPLPMTAETRIACEVASLHLNHALNEISEENLEIQMSQSHRIFPDERYNVMVEVRHKDGSPISLETLWTLRPLMSELSDDVIDASRLKAYKENLKNRYAMKMESQEYWLRAIIMRHLDGKDFTTSYASWIDSVDSEKVQSVFSALDDGTRIEYIMIKNK